MQNLLRQKNLLLNRSPNGILALAMVAGLAFLGCQKSDSPTGAVDANARITLVSPVGGEKLKVGETVMVKWTVKADQVDPITAVDLMVSPDSGKTWGYIRTGSVADDVPTWGNYPWIVSAKTVGTPSLNLAGAACLFRVMKYATDKPELMAVSKSTFTISVP
jgi:hypothetical protein